MILVLQLISRFNSLDSIELLEKAARNRVSQIAQQERVVDGVDEIQRSIRRNKLVVPRVDVLIGQKISFFMINLHTEVNLIQHRLGQLETGECELEVGPS